MKTDRKDMISRVKACLAKGTDPSGFDTLDIVAVSDPDWEHKDTLVSLYMYRVIGYMRAGTFTDRLNTFMLPKAARTGERFSEAELRTLAGAYTKTWDGETGDLDKLHTFVDEFTTMQLACIGI